MRYEAFWPNRGQVEELDASAFRLRVHDDYGQLVGLRLAFLTDSAGAFRDSAGSSRSISTPEDHVLLMSLRSLSDAVITSAKTAKIEGYQASKFSSMVIVAGSKCDLQIPALSQRAKPGCKKVFLVCHSSQLAEYAQASADFGFDVIALSTGEPGKLPAKDVLSELTKRGFGHVLFEGGPSLLESFLKEGLVDEFCLSTTFESENEKLSFATVTRILFPTTELMSLANNQGFKLYGSVAGDRTVFTRWRRAS